MIRVGFVCSFDDGWLGGINYYRNLLSALYALPERKVEAVIFTGHRVRENHFDGFPAIEIVHCRLLDRGTLSWCIRHIVRHRLSSDFLFDRLLRIHGVAVLSHIDWLPGKASVPTIGWIPDFQHVRLPEYFSSAEIALRNKCYSDMCKYCSTIIVSSFDAQGDLSRFSPGCTLKSEVLQFVVASIKPETILPGRGELEEKYKFSGNYFLLPNQFWKHKNHRVVIEALGLLGRVGKRVLVLATGSTTDYRHPEYFNSLMERAKELNVLDSFLHVGLVPVADLAGLMRDALAIINPSFFEGWSTTVEEAKALGKHAILSDIPVHREQNPALAIYFPPEDANALAAILWGGWNKSYSDELQKTEHARRITDERRIEFARKYQAIIHKVVGRS